MCTTISSSFLITARLAVSKLRKTQEMSRETTRRQKVAIIDADDDEYILYTEKRQREREKDGLCSPAETALFSGPHSRDMEEF